MLAALRSSRDFRLLVIGEMVSRAGSAASFVAIWSVAVYEFGVSPGVLSILALCNTLPRVVASMVSGRLVDRVGPRVVLLAANGLGLVGSLLQWASPSPLALGLATIVAGAGFGAFMPAIGSMTPRVVDDEHLLPANALMELTWQIGFIVGPLCGAVAIAWGGTRAPLLFDVATFVVGIACVVPITLRPIRTTGADAQVAAEHAVENVLDPTFDTGFEPGVATGSDMTVDPALGPAATTEADAGRGFIAGVRYTWSLPIARYVLILNTGSWLGIAFFIVLEPLYVADVLGAGPVVLGLLQTAFGLGAVCGAAIAARAEKRVVPSSLAVTIAVCGVGMIGYTISHSVAFAAAGVGFWGIGMGLWAPLSRTMIHRGVPVASHGRVNGVMSSVQSALEVLPVLAAGALAEVVGIQQTLIAAGIATLVLAAWGLTTADSVEHRARGGRLTPDLAPGA